MAFDLKDPRVTKYGKCILIDGIPFRLWALNKNVTPQVIQKWVTLGETIDQIEARYVNKKARTNNRATVEYRGKKMTIRELMSLGEHLEGLDMRIIRDRILNCKWDVRRALTTPLKPKVQTEVTYLGKTYCSVSEFARDLKVTPESLRYYNSRGYSLEEALDRIKSYSKKTFHYKGEQHTVGSLVKHPDNIHGINYGCLEDRIYSLKYSPEDALKFPIQISNSEFKVTYKGKKYRSKRDLFSKLGLGFGHYSLSNGVEPNTPEFDDLVDKIVSSIKQP